MLSGGHLARSARRAAEAGQWASCARPPGRRRGPVAGLSPRASPGEEWEAIAGRSSDASFLESLAALAATPEGRAALAATQQQWEAAGLEPPWPGFVPVPLADALAPGGFPADAALVPDGTTASRCTACGEVRLSYPGDRTDEWKHHPDHCPAS